MIFNEKAKEIKIVANAISRMAEILERGTIDGKPLSDKQREMIKRNIPIMTQNIIDVMASLYT